MNADSGIKKTVWLMAAGFGVPGGVEAHILHYAVEMRRRGWLPVVVIFKLFPEPAHRFMEALDSQNIPRVSLQEKASYRVWFYLSVWCVPWCVGQLVKGRLPRLNVLRACLSVREQMRLLRLLLERDAPSVLHVFGRLSHAAWRILPVRKTIFHQMMTGDIDGEWTTEEKTGFNDFLSRCAYCLVPGSGVAANMRHYFGIRSPMQEVFTLCPDAVGSEHFLTMIEERAARRDDCIRFGVICRLVEQKGIQYLLDALVQYRDRFGDVHFAFAGRGHLKEMIELFVKQHGLLHVTIEDVVDPVAFLSTIDLFVHPSIGDAMPMAIAEALMCGLPCVVSRVGGCADLVRDEVDGFVIEPHRCDEVLARMVRFREMSLEQRAEMGRNARVRYETCCRPDMVGEVVEGFYEGILNRG